MSLIIANCTSINRFSGYHTQFSMAMQTPEHFHSLIAHWKKLSPSIQFSQIDFANATDDDMEAATSVGFTYTAGIVHSRMFNIATVTQAHSTPAFSRLQKQRQNCSATIDA